jgi:SAM-dependent methyltransferase
MHITRVLGEVWVKLGLRSFVFTYIRVTLEMWLWHFRAVRDSMRLHCEEFSDVQFVRLEAYRELKRYLARREFSKNARAIEFGGSNGVIPKMLPNLRYEVASNFPEVDIQDLSNYTDHSYKIVVIDNILEHIPEPAKAIREIFRILETGGICICLTPFLIRVHGYPDDFWRFTESGLRKLFDQFNSVNVWSWGNRFTIATTMKMGWLSVRNSKRALKAALWNEKDWPIIYLTIARK